jgi:hypothetical protein
VFRKIPFKALCSFDGQNRENQLEVVIYETSDKLSKITQLDQHYLMQFDIKISQFIDNEMINKKPLNRTLFERIGDKITLLTSDLA